MHRAHTADPRPAPQAGVDRSCVYVMVGLCLLWVTLFVSLGAQGTHLLKATPIGAPVLRF